MGLWWGKEGRGEDKGAEGTVGGCSEEGGAIRRPLQALEKSRKCLSRGMGAVVELEAGCGFMLG